MRKIDNYIIEKLRINKNFKKVKGLLKVNESMMIISLRFTFESNKRLELKLYDPFKVINLTSKKIEYLTDQDKKISQDIFTNSNSYIETKMLNRIFCIYVNMEEGILFLEHYLESPTGAIESLKTFFDKEDEHFLNNYEIIQENSDEELKKILDELKKCV